MSASQDPIQLAEKVLAVLDLGSFSTTYKYALLTAILDLCVEKSSSKGIPPESLSTRQLAEKVIEQYWPHSVPYVGRDDVNGPLVLRQSNVRETQAEIVSAIIDFRRDFAADPSEPLFRVRQRVPEFGRLIHHVEWKLVEMPIPRLQVFGRDEDRFLYEYSWTKDISKRAVANYQRGKSNSFDNLLRLRPGVAETLVKLTGILRPILQREWSTRVARINRLEQAALEDFLFGAARVPHTPLRDPLSELQGGRCFYCRERIRGDAEVDHFIPWARYPDNSLDNLVLAHGRCNNQKRDFFAAAEHVERWSDRMGLQNEKLDYVEKEAKWTRNRDRSRSVALALYSRLPDTVRLWRERDEFVPMESKRIVQALARS